jgi:hypothetical protein
MTGYLSEFTLPELLQLIAEGNKSGELIIGDAKIPHAPNCCLPDCHEYHIWFNQGEIVAMANLPDNRGLISLLEQRGWLNERAAALIPQIVKSNSPLGLSLKSANLLQAEQLKLLFQAQVMQPIGEIFTWKTGWFDFKKQTTLPTAEMTGLSRSATEVLLTGLRSLRDWSALEEKLPDPNSGLISLIPGKPSVQLDTSEGRVWAFTQGQLTIKDIAKSLSTSVDSVQRIAFRLILAGLAEESAIVEPTASVASNGSDRALDPLVESLPPSAAADLGVKQPPTSVKPSVPNNPNPARFSTPSNNIVYRRAETPVPSSASKATVPPSSSTSAPSQNYFQNLVSFLRNKGNK